MARERVGVPVAEQIVALFESDHLRALGDLVPRPPAERGGRPRSYPDWAIVLFCCLSSVYRSGRRVETELTDAGTWDNLRDLARRTFPEEPEMWLPERPMTRRRFRYIRDRYLTDDAVYQSMLDEFRRIAVAQARELGLCDPAGLGSETHPDLTRTLYGDGKVVTPLYKGDGKKTAVNRETGEIRTRRHDPDAKLHVTGGGQRAYGIKYCWFAVRQPDAHGRIILDLEPDLVRNEGAASLLILDRIAPLLPGAQAVVYDGAFRGKHNEHILRLHGLTPVSNIKSEKGQRRHTPDVQERVRAFQDATIKGGTRAGRVVRLAAEAGAVGEAVINVKGDTLFIPYQRHKLYKRRNADGTYRVYQRYAEPSGGFVDVSMNGTAADRKAKFNRTENVRCIPQSDPDYARLLGRRQDIESINRSLDDTLWLGRAHSLGHRRQRFDLLCFAVLKNAIAVRRHRQRQLQQAPPDAA